LIDIFRIGIHIGMTTNAGEVLSTMLRHLVGVNARVEELNRNLGRMRGLAVSAVGAFAGFEGLKFIKDIVDSSKELNKQLEQTKNMGGDFAATIPQQYRRAFEISREVPTSVPHENVKQFREVGSQLDNITDAMSERVAPFMAKLSYLIGNLGREDSDKATQNIVKAIENVGGTTSTGPDGQKHFDVNKLLEYLNLAYKAINISGGLFTSADLLAMSKTAGVAGRMEDPRAFFLEQMEMAISMGASRTGTAQTSLLNQLIGGTMPVHTAHDMQRVGMLRPGEWRSDHGHIVLSNEARERFAQVARDPLRWVREQFVPMLEKLGMNEMQILQEIFKVFGRQTTQRYIAEGMQNAPQQERALRLSQQMPGVAEAYQELHEHDLTTNEKELAAAWQGLREALGSPEAIQAEISVLHALTDAIHALTYTVTHHTVAATRILELSAALSALVAVGGTLGVITFALRGFASAASLFAGGAAISGITALTGGLRNLAGAAIAAGAVVGAISAKEGLQRGSDIVENKVFGAGHAEAVQKLHEQGAAQFWNWLFGKKDDTQPAPILPPGGTPPAPPAAGPLPRPPATPPESAPPRPPAAPTNVGQPSVPSMSGLPRPPASPSEAATPRPAGVPPQAAVQAGPQSGTTAWIRHDPSPAEIARADQIAKEALAKVLKSDKPPPPGTPVITQAQALAQLKTEQQKESHTPTAVNRAADWLHDFLNDLTGETNYVNAPPPPASPGPPEPKIDWKTAPPPAAHHTTEAAPYHPNRTILQTLQMQGVVNLDGKKVGTFVAKSQADALARPPAGPTAPDSRLSLPQPGQLAPIQ
jgi:hypothetical protein